MLSTDTIASLVLHAITNDAQVLWLPTHITSLANDLGNLYRTNARYIVMHASRLSKWSKVEPHLQDSLAYPQLEILAITGEINAQDAALVYEQMTVQATELVCSRGHWQLRGIPMNQVPPGMHNVWPALQKIAAGIFKIEPNALHKFSTPDNTAGWDSLAFVAFCFFTKMTTIVLNDPMKNSADRFECHQRLMPQMFILQSAIVLLIRLQEVTRTPGIRLKQNVNSRSAKINRRC